MNFFKIPSYHSMIPLPADSTWIWKSATFKHIVSIFKGALFWNATSEFSEIQ